MLSSLINFAIVLVSLSTATGVLLHDTRVDKAAATSLATSAITVYDANTKLVNFGNDLHPSHERSVIEQSIRDFGTQNDPRIQPRTSEDKKYLLQKYAVRGHHAFDNYNLPIV